VSPLSASEEFKQCTFCRSNHLSTLNGEIALHFSSLPNLDTPATFVFPEVYVCLDCGNAHFALPEPARLSLARTSSAASRIAAASRSAV
jgi:hypothetical protein